MSKLPGKRLHGTVVSVHSGDRDDLSKPSSEEIHAGINGISGDRHGGFDREAWHGEWLDKGTVRRNERQWSGISQEELSHISQALDLARPLTAETVGANLCVSGIPDFSLLPKGTMLLFPSGAALNIEEYNPPCADMGAQIAEGYETHSGRPLKPLDWLKPAAGRRGVVGVVEVPGVIRVGDEIEVVVYKNPSIKRY